MNHQYTQCYEQHIVSTKKEYEDSLLSILTPLIYEGLNSMYNTAIDLNKRHDDARLYNPNIESPGILTLFQLLIKEIPNLNTHKIKQETSRIRSASNHADIFDDLIKAVFKSHIILLSFNCYNKNSELINKKYHENIIIHEFIHKCYIECSRVIYGYPELFWQF